MTTTRRHFIRSAIAGLIAAAALMSSHPIGLTAAHSAPGCAAGAYCDQYAVDMSREIDPVADCLTSQGFRGRPDDGSETIYATADAIEACAAYPVGDLSALVSVDTDGAPADLVACWTASGARYDGPGILTASRLTIDSCNPLGWVGA